MCGKNQIAFSAPPFLQCIVMSGLMEGSEGCPVGYNGKGWWNLGKIRKMHITRIIHQNTYCTSHHTLPTINTRIMPSLPLALVIGSNYWLHLLARRNLWTSWARCWGAVAPHTRRKNGGLIKKWRAHQDVCTEMPVFVVSNRFFCHKINRFFVVTKSTVFVSFLLLWPSVHNHSSGNDTTRAEANNQRQYLNSVQIIY